MSIGAQLIAPRGAAATWELQGRDALGRFKPLDIRSADSMLSTPTVTAKGWEYVRHPETGEVYIRPGK